MSGASERFTELLRAWSGGDPDAAEKLLPLVYDELRGLAARAMRRVLLDHARARHAAKRAGDWERVTLDEQAASEDPRELDLIALNTALEDLQGLDPEKSRLVELRFFGGLSVEEAADVLGVSPSTVAREWRLARAWLYRRLEES